MWKGTERKRCFWWRAEIRRYRPVVQFESTVTDQRHRYLSIFPRLDTQGAFIGKHYLHYSNPDSVLALQSLGW